MRDFSELYHVRRLECGAVHSYVVAPPRAEAPASARAWERSCTSQGGGCLRVGIGARSTRRHALRAKCNFAPKCGSKLELGTEEKKPRTRGSGGDRGSSNPQPLFQIIQRNRPARPLVFGERLTRGGQILRHFARFQLRQIVNQRSHPRGPFGRRAPHFFRQHRQPRSWSHESPKPAGASIVGMSKSPARCARGGEPRAAFSSCQN